MINALLILFIFNQPIIIFADSKFDHSSEKVGRAKSSAKYWVKRIETLESAFRQYTEFRFSSIKKRIFLE